MSGPSNGLSGEYGDCHLGSTQLIELVEWNFTPSQKLGDVVTNVTGGFTGQVQGAVGGKGDATLLIPRSGYTNPPTFGTTPTLNLYADAARVHGFTQMPISVETGSVKLNLASPDGVRLKFNFRANGPYNATGAFAMLGPYNQEVTSSSGT